jgi:hypothetical protein
VFEHHLFVTFNFGFHMLYKIFSWFGEDILELKVGLNLILATKLVY